METLHNLFIPDIVKIIDLYLQKVKYKYPYNAFYSSKLLWVERISTKETYLHGFLKYFEIDRTCLWMDKALWNYFVIYQEQKKTGSFSQVHLLGYAPNTTTTFYQIYKSLIFKFFPRFRTLAAISDQVYHPLARYLDLPLWNIDHLFLLAVNSDCNPVCFCPVSSVYQEWF